MGRTSRALTWCQFLRRSVMIGVRKTNGLHRMTRDRTNHGIYVVPTLSLPSLHPRAIRHFRTGIRARRVQQAHVHIVHWDGAPDCICGQSVWYFAKRKSVGHHHHCEMCHPRYRNGYTRTRVKRFIVTSGLIPSNKQLKVFYGRISSPSKALGFKRYAAPGLTNPEAMTIPTKPSL